MAMYEVRRSRLALFVGYFLAEDVLIGILVAMFFIWKEEPTYLDWPLAIVSWVAVALFFHFLLFSGTFYCIRVNGEMIEYHAFLRRTKRLHFSDIRSIKPSIGVDVKIVGHNNKRLFYVKRSDRNFNRFVADVAAYIK